MKILCIIPASCMLESTRFFFSKCKKICGKIMCYLKNDEYHTFFYNGDIVMTAYDVHSKRKAVATCSWT